MLWKEISILFMITYKMTERKEIYLKYDTRYAGLKALASQGG
jgi:hypothetical protein